MSWRPGLTSVVVAAALIGAAVLPMAGAQIAGSPTVAAPLPALAAPEHRVVMVSDSVGLGAATALPLAFPPGWDVNVIGTPAHFVEMLESVHVRPQLASNPQMFGDHVVIAGGYNYPYWDPARFDRSIDSMIATLTANGVEHVYWVTLREVKPQFVTASAWNQVQPYYWYFPTVNEHLRRAVERHPQLTLIDWAAAADRPGITYDAIHLNTVGAAAYSALVAATVQDSLVRLPNGGVTRIPVGAAAGAVALNITSTGSRAGGYFAAYPCDQTRPDVSNLNHARAQTVAAAAIVPVAANGEICVYNHQAGHLIVDLFGRFSGTGAIEAAPPARLVDTRLDATRQLAWTTRSVRVTAPAGTPGRAAAVALNVTAVDALADGYVSVHPCSITSPDTSNVNFVAGAAVPNLVVAAPDGDGNVCVTASATTHLLVDRFASFADPTTTGTTGTKPMRLITPRRVIDTRRDPAPPAAEQVVKFSIGDAGLSPSEIGSDGRGGIFANVTIAEPAGGGYATVYPCDSGRPATSNVNYVAGRTVANMVTVRPDSTGAVCVYTLTAAEVIVDVLGATGDGFVGIVPERIVDTRS